MKEFKLFLTVILLCLIILGSLSSCSSKKDDLINNITNFINTHMKGNISEQWSYEITKFKISKDGTLIYHVITSNSESLDKKNYDEYKTNLKNIDPSRIKNNYSTLGLYCKDSNNCIELRFKRELSNMSKFITNKQNIMFISFASASTTDKDNMEKEFEQLISLYK